MIVYVGMLIFVLSLFQLIAYFKMAGFEINSYGKFFDFKDMYYAKRGYLEVIIVAVTVLNPIIILLSVAMLLTP